MEAVKKQQLNISETKQINSPWWVINPPAELSINIQRLLPGSNCRLGPIDIVSPEGEKSVVFVKVFDESKSGNRWGDDAIRQRGLRETYARLYPDETSPILQSAPSSDSEGHEVIIMDCLPDIYTQTLAFHMNEEHMIIRDFRMTIEPNTLTREQKREIFSKCATTYLHFCRTGITWTKEHYDSNNNCYYGFFDQKHGDIIFQQDTQRVIITDIQSLARENLLEIIQGYLSSYFYLFCPRGDQPYEAKMRELIFTPDEIHLIDRLRILFRDNYRRESKLTELIDVLEDFTTGQLKPDDKRLESTVEEKKI